MFGNCMTSFRCFVDSSVLLGCSPEFCLRHCAAHITCKTWYFILLGTAQGIFLPQAVVQCNLRCHPASLEMLWKRLWDDSESVQGHTQIKRYSIHSSDWYIVRCPKNNTIPCNCLGCSDCFWMSKVPETGLDVLTHEVATQMLSSFPHDNLCFS